MPRIQFVLTHIAGSGCGASFSGPAVGGKPGLAGSFQAVAAGLPDGVSAALVFVVGGGQPPLLLGRLRRVLFHIFGVGWTC